MTNVKTQPTQLTNTTTHKQQPHNVFFDFVSLVSEIQIATLCSRHVFCDSETCFDAFDSNNYGDRIQKHAFGNNKNMMRISIFPNVITSIT